MTTRRCNCSEIELINKFLFEAKMTFTRFLLLTVTAVLLLTVTNSSYGQDPASPPSDPIEQLQLTPEQRQRVRLIFAENKDERQMANRRLREARVALDLALDAETVNEALIDQRINELTTAQGAQLRMRIQMELKIRRELRPEQLAAWRRLRLQLQDFADAQRPNQRPANQGRRPNQQNGLAPVPRRNINRP